MGIGARSDGQEHQEQKLKLDRPFLHSNGIRWKGTHTFTGVSDPSLPCVLILLYHFGFVLRMELVGLSGNLGITLFS